MSFQEVRAPSRPVASLRSGLRARLASAVVSALGVVVPLAVHAADEYENAPIRYSETEPHDVGAVLARELATGKSPLPVGDDRQAFLRAVLERFGIPEASQVLVFSKTSLQNDRIEPRTPRAIYFNDDVYVGSVRGGDVEIAAMDPQLGPVFWVLRPDGGDGRPVMRRDGGCLSCHAGSRVRHTPGILVRSVWPDEYGFPILSQGSFVTRPQSPMSERWGGWYVTGLGPGARHMGNLIARKTDEGVEVDPMFEGQPETLAGKEAVVGHLRPTSDIVALLVLEHQAEVHNAMTRANFAARSAIHRQTALQSALGEEVDEKPRGTALRIIQGHVERLVEAMMSSGEAVLEHTEIRGDPDFRAAFLASRKPDSKGRSLRDLDLRTRVFRHRLSYLIYSPSFDALPTAVRELFWKELDKVLSGAGPADRFGHLEAEELVAIREILLDTKPEARAYWTQSTEATPAE